MISALHARSARPAAAVKRGALLLVGLLATPPLMAGSLQLTHAPAGHQIHNRQCFSPDGAFLYFDSRSDETRLADSRAIGRVALADGRTEILYRATGSCVGAVTCRRNDGMLAFIHGLPGMPYAPHARSAATLSAQGGMLRLDARDVSEPFTRGSSRGGTHAFHWSPSGALLSCTYNDAIVPVGEPPRDLRTLAVLVPGRPVTVEDAASPREFSGTATMALVVPVLPSPRPGSDELLRAFDEDWLDDRTMVFQGMVLAASGKPLTEIFSATLPGDMSTGALPPRASGSGLPDLLDGVRIRRLTRTEFRRHPGVQGPRHWVRSAPDGRHAAFLAKDGDGVVQIFQVPREGGEIRALSRLREPVQDVFDWSPCGRWLACVAGGRIHLIEAATGISRPLTEPAIPEERPRYAVVFSPDGRRIATNRPTLHADGRRHLQIHLVDVPQAQPQGNDHPSFSNRSP